MFLRLLFVFSKFHPELRDNWNRKLNTRIDPMQVTASGTNAVYWVCTKCGRK